MSNVAEITEQQPISTQVAEFNEFETSLAEYKAQYEGVVYDLSEPAQVKAAKSDKYAIGKTVGALDRKHKEIKAPLLERVALLDGERKRIKDGLRGIQAEIAGQLEAHEEAEKARQDALRAKVDQIRALALFSTTATVTLIQSRLFELSAVEVDDSFEELKPEAALAYIEAHKTLDGLLSDVKEKEAIAAEQKRLAREAERARKEIEAKAQAEREQRIAAEARAQAEQEAADALERERQARVKATEDAAAAAVRAEKDRTEAARLAQEREDRAVREAEAKARAEQEAKDLAAREKLALERAEQRERAADEEHRAAVRHAIIAALAMHCELGELEAYAVVEAIDDNKIPRVSITY